VVQLLSGLHGRNLAGARNAGVRPPQERRKRSKIHDRSEEILPLDVSGRVLAACRLRLLGGFSLTGPDGADIAIRTRKNRGLMAVLALSPGRSASREQVCNLLWSDQPDGQGRAALRQSLAVLRKELGKLAGLLQTEGDRLHLRPLDADACFVLAAARSDDSATLRRAAAMLGGDLLADTSIRDAAFDDWLSATRRQITDATIAILEKLVHTEHGPDRVAIARRLVDTDALREKSHHLLIQALLDIGEPGLAQRQQDAMRKVFRDELGIEPAAVPPVSHPGLSAPAPERAAPDADRPSVAVLPFEDLGGDDDTRSLARGFSADLAHELRRFGELAVILGDRDRPDLPPGANRAGFELGGAFRRSGGRLRLSIRLRATASGELLWSEQFDSTTADLFDILDRIITASVYRIVNGVNQSTLAALRRSRARTFGAYELFLQARENAYRLTRKTLAEAELQLERSIAIDPEFAPAHAWLAEVNFLTWWAGWADDGDARLAECYRLGRRAVDLDATDAFAWAQLGQSQTLRREFQAARQSLDRALYLNPHDPDAITINAFHLLYSGKAEDADAAIRGAMLRDPSGHYGLVHGMILLRLEQWEKAAASLSLVRNRMPDVHLWLAASQAMQGQAERCRDALTAFATASGASPAAAAAQTLGRNPFQHAADTAAFRAVIDAALATWQD
jgi:DNA-binding SARP family transcriptional activator/TolB-like protein